MPTFGKGRINRKLTKKRKLETHIYSKNGRKFLRERRRYPVDNSSLNSYSVRFNLNINNWIKKRFNKTKKPVFVLDWGCGKGNALTELAKTNKNVKCYGFARDSHNEWRNNSHVKFIQNDAESLFRYFKNGSLDLVISRLGLLHLGNGFFDYAVRVSEKLNQGGVLVSDIPSRDAILTTENFCGKYNNLRKKKRRKTALKEKFVIPSKGIDVEINWVSNIMKIKKVS